MDIHAALALGSVFRGVALFGPSGAIIGIPLAAAALAVMDTYGKRRELIPELQVRTKGEKPARDGDAFAGDPDVVAPAGLPVTDLAPDAPAPDRANET